MSFVRVQAIEARHRAINSFRPSNFFQACKPDQSPSLASLSDRLEIAKNPVAQVCGEKNLAKTAGTSNRRTVSLYRPEVGF